MRGVRLLRVAKTPIKATEPRDGRAGIPVLERMVDAGRILAGRLLARLGRARTTWRRTLRARVDARLTDSPCLVRLAGFPTPEVVPGSAKGGVPVPILLLSAVPVLHAEEASALPTFAHKVPTPVCRHPVLPWEAEDAQVV